MVARTVCYQTYCRYTKSETFKEQNGQVLAKIWALNALLNQPIIGQVQVSIVKTGNTILLTPFVVCCASQSYYDDMFITTIYAYS